MESLTDEVTLPVVDTRHSSHSHQLTILSVTEY